MEKNSKGWEIGVRSVELSQVGKEVMGGDVLVRSFLPRSGEGMVLMRAME